MTTMRAPLVLCALVCLLWLPYGAQSAREVIRQNKPYESRARAYMNAVPQRLFEMVEPAANVIADYEMSLSSLKNNKKHTRWLPYGQYPRTALEELVIRLGKMAKPTWDEFAGYEWWIQRVGDSDPIGFHVDKDESVASNKHYLSHPEWSSIFYVTNEGGGTLLTDQYSPFGNGYSPEVPQAGELSMPIKNKYVVFKGDLLHGVLPGRYEQNPDDHESTSKPYSYSRGSAGGDGVKRITFLVNYWKEKPEEPNCLEIDYADIPQMKVYTREEMEVFRAQLDADIAATPKPQRRRRQPTTRVLLTPGHKTPSYEYKINLPGGRHQVVSLPKHTKLGDTYTLQWDPNYTPAKKPKKQTQKAAPVEKKSPEGGDDALRRSIHARKEKKTQKKQRKQAKKHKTATQTRASADEL